MNVEEIKEKILVCSFCGSVEKEVDFLVEGNSAYICDICVSKAGEIINKLERKLTK